jgi:hypothetical protein
MNRKIKIQMLFIPFKIALLFALVNQILFKKKKKKKTNAKLDFITFDSCD